MRRKNRKWVATAAALYFFVMWSAYRWGVAQRPTDGNIFEHIEREGLRKNAEARSPSDSSPRQCLISRPHSRCCRRTILWFAEPASRPPEVLYLRSSRNSRIGRPRQPRRDRSSSN